MAGRRGESWGAAGALQQAVNLRWPAGFRQAVDSPPGQKRGARCLPAHPAPLRLLRPLPPLRPGDPRGGSGPLLRDGKERALLSGGASQRRSLPRGLPFPLSQYPGPGACRSRRCPRPWPHWRRRRCQPGAASTTHERFCSRRTRPLSPAWIHNFVGAPWLPTSTRRPLPSAGRRSRGCAGGRGPGGPCLSMYAL